MNKTAATLLLIASLGTGGAQAFIYESSFEIQADGDFDGDGRRDLVILDKATGGYRIAYQTTPGVYTWAAARASGISGATGLGIGKLNSLAYDSLAVTGPDANRVNILDANLPGAAGLPNSVYVPSLGPNTVAVTDIGGAGPTAHDDLYVASIYNGAAAFRETLLRNNGTTNRTVLGDNPLLYLRERANPVLLHTNRPARLALMDRNAAPTFDVFRVLDLSGGAPSPVIGQATSLTPKPYEYVQAQFVVTNPYTQVLFYPPTGWYLYEYQVAEVAGAYALYYTNIFTFTNFIDRLYALPGTNGCKLLMYYTNGVSGAVYDFDGMHAPTVAQQFNADPGEHFTGAGVLGNSGFMAYSAPLGENTSSRFKQWKWTGSGYSNSASGDLPRLTTYSASGNVLQFQYEPFVTNNPMLLRLNSAGDWSGRPFFSGSPLNVSVTTETFLNSTQGLANPVTSALGVAHPLAAFGLGNQYTNNISLFSFTPPAGDKISDVTISPQPGLYPASIQLGFAAANPADKIFFRVGSGAWVAWSNTLVARVFTNSVVQYYGQPASGGAKSAVKSASYSFTSGPATLDSDGDGVPDYAELAYGLNPNGGRDSDGDGYSDLEEMIRGTKPDDKTSFNTNYPHLDDQAVFDLRVTPRPWDGFSSGSTLAATGTVLRAYNFQGSLLGVGTITSILTRRALLSALPLVAEDRLVSRATEQHYSIVTTNSDPIVGREMVGLTALPPLTFPTISYVYSGGNITNEASNWIASAAATLTNLPRAALTNELTVNHTLQALLFEMATARILGARGTNWWTNITLFPFRVGDVTRTNVPRSVMLSLESATTNQPGYKLQTMFATISNLVENSANLGMASLRQVVRDVYGIDSRLNNTNPATFASPVDEIRYFLWHGTLESNYLFWASTSGQFASASNGVNFAMASIPPRPTTNVWLVVRPDTMIGACRVLDLWAGGGSFALLDDAGRAFNFPDNFSILPGSKIAISGYTDVTNTACGYPAIEVTSALLSSVPIATDNDLDGNLMIDTWEKQFFGYVGLVDPFGDADGDGYSNLQEMLEGSDPRDYYGRPAGPAASFLQPVLVVSLAGAQTELHFHWPPAFLSRFDFGVRHSSEVSAPFTALGSSSPLWVSGDEYKIVFATPAAPQHFYYLTIALH